MLRARMGGRSRRRSRCALLACAFAFLAAPAEAKPRPLSRDAYEARLFELVNAERARHGLQRLARGRCATASAERWSERIAREERLRHQRLRAVLSACSVRRAAENVAAGDVSPEGMMRLWMKSRRHRANLLDRRVTHLGVGAARSRNGTWYGVQVFLGY